MNNEALERLSEIFTSGQRTCDAVIEDAKNPESPLHGEFEWNPELAHPIYLKDRARQLIREWYVKNETKPGVTVRSRGAYSLPTETEDGELSFRTREYYTMDEIADRGDLTERLLKTALWELRAFRHKYASLTQLAGLFAELDRIESVVAPVYAARHGDSDRPTV